MSFDVLIVGGAAVGSAAAYFLCASPDFQGRVCVLEQDPSYARSATALSVASIRHQFSTPENIRLSQFGSEFIRHIDQHLAVDGEVPALQFNERGYLFMATPPGLEVLRSNHSTQRELGADVCWLEPQELAQRYPWLRTDDLAAATWGCTGEGWLDAYALLQGFRRRALALGATYRQARVTQLLRQGNRVKGVQLADGEELAAGLVINAAGIGATALARSAGIELPIESRKRSVFFVTSNAQLPNCPMVIDPSGAYFRPEGEGFICGIAPPPHEDPACEEFEVQHRLFDESLWPLLAQRVPGFEALRVKRSWAGHYDMNTLDHNAILGPHPHVDGILFANGFSGHGLQHSPGVGRALAEWVIWGESRSINLRALGFERVLAQRPLREVNVV
ncbi:MAG: FAD-binding oxidoreductase [Alphaproteobacteria bacterium]|nr:FAD-binding oxidoreductase [Alphaproteobacteria bacterium]